MLDFERYKVLTFDCYGTLIDWETGIVEALRPVLDHHGVAASDDRILETYAEAEAKLEGGDYVRYELVLRFVTAEMSYHLRFDADDDELDCLSRSVKNWRPFDDTVDALKRLKKRYKLAIVSNTDDVLFEQTSKHLEVEFDYVITAQQAQAYKPSERVFEFAAARIGLPREEILHVAQSLYHDIVPARRLGIANVWVNRQYERDGFGATRAAVVEPDMEVRDLKSLADAMGL